ncbi:MAG: DUF4091 domain-containing protein [Planctomycetes bacterium]|nr:DUF4091 domain-containing protein [Planctomycetota bacterium]
MRPRDRHSTCVFGGGLLLFLWTGGCLDPARTGEVTVWIVGDGEQITADSPPVLENDVYSASRRIARLKSAINETVALQVGLHTAATSAGPFDLEVTDLSGPSGTLAARANVSVYRAQWVQVERFESWYPGHTGNPAQPTLFPDILVPWEARNGGGPVTLGNSRNELLWIDIHVPPTTEPGDYAGRLRLRPHGRSSTIFECETRLRVVPVALPSVRSLPIICRVDPRDLLAAHLRWPRDPPEQLRLLPDAPGQRPAIELINATMQALHEHRLTPVLWASFPKYRPVGDRAVEIEWDAYDRLMAGWIDGQAFPDQVGLARWPVPADSVYPNADQNGGISSPRYARLLAAYLQECQRHFAERGWLPKAFVRVCPPAAPTQAYVDRVRRLAGILRQSESGLPLVAHLPARSLSGLGWQNAPEIKLPDVNIWAPSAMWYEPAALERERALGKQTWFAPDRPPYSGSLAVEAPPGDVRTLAWQAYRYDSEAIWIEHATDVGTSAHDRTARRFPHREALVYAGVDYGLLDRPVASIRLKRLRRGVLDYELLRLLERSGKRLLAKSIAAQVVRWGHTEACLDHLLSCRAAGWPQDPSIMRMARELILQELVNEFSPANDGTSTQIGNLGRWYRVMNQTARVQAELRGVRLLSDPQHSRARAAVALTNGTNRALTGRWKLAPAPVGWRQTEPVDLTIPAQARGMATVDLELTALSYNLDGVYPFNLVFDTEAMGAFALPARLAVAACPRVDVPPQVDGDLGDWSLASNNAAGDFRLCRGRRAARSASPQAALDETGDTPELPTRAFFCMDDERLYVGVQCELRRGETPIWRADNRVPLDGAVPWAQDVVEVLINPTNAAVGTSSDVFILQIKPSGSLLARQGCRTEPPMGTSLDWQTGATLAVDVQRDAWVIELALPFSAFPPEAPRSRVWGLNVTRLDARRGEYSSWSGARGHCYSPQSLGNLVLLRQ